MGGIVGNQFAQGGVSPAQMALSQFDLGQGILGNAQAFAGTQGQGIGGGSTMETMLDAGARNKQALDLQAMSQSDANALAANAQQQKAGLSSGIGTLGTLIGGGI